MNIVTIKETAAFPEIGQVRKGMPKGEKTIGKDLGTKFRIVWFAGQENQLSRQKFTELHPEAETLGQDVIVPKLTVFLPFPDPFDCFNSSYEAYTAGRMVARADGEKFLRWVDTKTGQLKVDNGEPYTPFTPGMVVGSYKNQRTGNTEVIKAKAVGRLRVFLPELVRMAYLTVHTTSIYDVVHITEQLRALEWMSRFLPNRVGVAGIPLILSRRMTSVTWVQDDGSARRVQTGLINIEADPDWVAKMLTSMSRMALPAQIGDEEKLRQALQPGEEVKLDIPAEDQEQASEQAEQGDSEFTDAEFTQETGETSVEITSSATNEQQQSTTDNNQQSTNNQPPMNGSPRPYNLATLRSKLEERAKKYHTKASPAQRGLVAHLLEKTFACEGASEMRHTVQVALFGKASLNEVPDAFIWAMLNDWLRPVQDTGGEYKIDDMAAREIRAAYAEALKAEGQAEFKFSGLETDQ